MWVIGCGRRTAVRGPGSAGAAVVGDVPIGFSRPGWAIWGLPVRGLARVLQLSRSLYIIALYCSLRKHSPRHHCATRSRAQQRTRSHDSNLHPAAGPRAGLCGPCRRRHTSSNHQSSRAKCRQPCPTPRSRATAARRYHTNKCRPHTFSAPSFARATRTPDVANHILTT